MLLQASQIINLPVAAETSLAKIGEVKDIIVNSAGDQLIALLIQPVKLFSKRQFCSFSDIIEFDPAAVIIHSPGELVAPAEIVRANQMIQEKSLPLGALVITENGRRLGRVNDFVFKANSGVVKSYYVRGLVKDLVIAASRVVGLEKKRIIVKKSEDPNDKSMPND